jgi:hypothetical protein
LPVELALAALTDEALDTDAKEVTSSGCFPEIVLVMVETA